MRVTRSTVPIRRLSMAAFLLVVGTQASAQERRADDWTFDASLYAVFAGMSGDVTAGGISGDLDVGFDDILDNLEAGGMGNVRVGYGRWALTTDVVYMGLGTSKRGVSAEFDQWIVEPSVSCEVSVGVELLAGVRYINLSGELRGPGVLPTPRVASGTQDFWDPIFGAHFSRPLGESWSIHFRGDIGGFGVGSDLTWQAFPYVQWRLLSALSMEVGYRVLYIDYESGSGGSLFEYDVLTQGPQLGFTVHF